MSEETTYTGQKRPILAYIGIRGALEAIELYKKAFGAKELMKPFVSPEGKVGHAELEIYGGVIMLSDEHPDYGVESPTSLGGSHASLVVSVPNADEAVAKAVEAGMELLRPVKDQFYGDRSGGVKDRFGYLWTLSHHVEDVSEGEMHDRAEKLFGPGGTSD